MTRYDSVHVFDGSAQNFICIGYYTKIYNNLGTTTLLFFDLTRC